MTTDTNREAIEQLEEWFADNYSEDIAWGDLLTAALEETGLSLAKQATVPVVGEGELAPCPFCGGTAELRQQYHYGRDEPNGDWFVICPPCDLIRDQAFNVPREQAITAWNTRALARQDRQALPVGVEDAIAWIDDQCAALEYACAGDGDYEVYRLQNEKWRSIAALISRLSAQVHVGEDVDRIAKVLEQDHQLSCCACNVPADAHAAKARKLAEAIAALRDTE